MRGRVLPLSARCGKSVAPPSLHRNEMSIFNGNSFLDRQTAAANAKKAQAEKFLARPKYDPNDPAIIEREAKRRAINEARDKRAAERAVLKAKSEAELVAKLAAEEIARQ